MFDDYPALAYLTMISILERLRFTYILILLLCALSNPGNAIAEAGPGGIVQGKIDLVDMHYEPGIPDVEVYVVNNSTLRESVRVFTDSKGAFVIPNQPAGQYILCWSDSYPGIVAGCDSTFPFEISNRVSLRYISATPTFDPTFALITGRVNLLPVLPSDSAEASCLHSDPFFDIDKTAIIEVVDANNLLVAKTRANTDGKFLIGVRNPLPGGGYKLRASCSLRKTEIPVNIGPVGSVISQDLELPINHKPVITGMVARLAGQAVAGVPLGTTVNVRVTASDKDGDVFFYRWRSTAGTVQNTNTPNVSWTLPSTGKGLHFLYVDVSDQKGGHVSRRVAISTDGGIVAATPKATPRPLASDVFPETDRFLTYRGLDTRKSACQYYLALKAVTGCDASGNPIGPKLTFAKWRARNSIGGPKGPAQLGEIQASFRNVADLDLVRNHHARKVNASHISYYVCNHGKATGAVPDINLVACVAMEYSIIPGVNNNKPFVQFYTFGPTGELYLSVNLDGRGEKFLPGNCVVCHGGDGYFHHFPESGVTARDANIGAYMLPFDLDNYEYDTAPNRTRAAQEDAVRRLNLLIKETSPTPVARQLIDGWYPGGIGKQRSNFVPPGWNETLDKTLPAKSRGDAFDASELYLKVVKHSCRLCHVAMGTKLGLDFNRYSQLVKRDSAGNPILDPITGEPVPLDDPTTAPDDRVGDFVAGHSDDIFGEFNQIGQNNDLHTYSTVCDKDGNGPSTWNIFDNIVEPGKTMPNALQTFNRFWQDPEQIALIHLFLEREVGITSGSDPNNDCDPTFRPPWAAQP
ncbi:MAG: hypothetical protein ABL863_13770 [Nitrosomonas sp.]